jgi:acetyltransferase-like isoleucine patch superfamily enzyme
MRTMLEAILAEELAEVRQEALAHLVEADKLPWAVHSPTLLLQDGEVYDELPNRMEIGGGSRVDSFCKLESGVRLRIGRYVHISSFCHIGGGGGETVIGDYVGLASGAKVISGTNGLGVISGSVVAPAPFRTVKRMRTVLEDFVFLATNAVVQPGVRMFEGAVLAAGGVATCDIPAWEIWGGVPARKIKDRIVRREG